VSPDLVAEVPPPDRRGVGRRGVGRLHVVASGFPIGALACCSLFDIASHTASEPYTFPRASFWLLVLGVIGTGIVGTVGLVALARARWSGSQTRQAVWHVALTDAAALVAIASVATRLHSDYSVPVGYVPLALGLAATALVVVGGSLGGRLVDAEG
jgi:uncharacterized membrane protein